MFRKKKNYNGSKETRLIKEIKNHNKLFLGLFKAKEKITVLNSKPRKNYLSFYEKMEAIMVNNTYDTILKR